MAAWGSARGLPRLGLDAPTVRCPRNRGKFNLGGTNDASGASPPGTYDAGEPILIQWHTPLPDSASYRVRVELTVETTYDDGTVRTFEFSGSIAATVVYSAISH